MRLVIIESPFAAPSRFLERRNIAYARACIRDCLLRGEAPYASHLLYTQDGVLDDSVAEQRELGIEAGFCWRRRADVTAVYEDLGVSRGMGIGIRDSLEAGIPIERRRLGGVWLDWKRWPRQRAR
jgi:hypothetical protein